MAQAKRPGPQFWNDYVNSCTLLESEFVKAGSFVIDPSFAIEKLIKEHLVGYYLQDSLDTRRGLRDSFRSALTLGILWSQFRYLYRCYSGYIIYKVYAGMLAAVDDEVRLITFEAIQNEIQGSQQCQQQSAPEGVASSQEEEGDDEAVSNQWLADLWQIRNQMHTRARERESSGRQELIQMHRGRH